MKICGIVAEFNPFHNGHAHLLRQTRQLLGDDSAIVCCMSGSFVQRGEAALLPKHLRAAAAVSCGADLVLELPAAGALRSAEGFAQSALSILDSLGQVTDLTFGAEDADTDLLAELADILLEHRTVQDTLAQLRTGVSYAAARERALYAQVQERAEVLRRPNNILAVEYCKAIRQQGCSITPHAIPRAGAAHDAAVPSGDFASASLLRRKLGDSGIGALDGFLPAPALAVLEQAQNAGQVLETQARLDAAVLPHLLRLDTAALSQLPDAAEGLEHRLYAAIRQSRTLEGMAQAAQTRRYPLARVRRMLLCAYLGITAEEAAAPPVYLRVLAFSDRGRLLLRRGAKTARLPLITKPAHARDLGGAPGAAFQREALRTDLYHLTLPGGERIPLGEDWRSNPVYFTQKSVNAPIFHGEQEKN